LFPIAERKNSPCCPKEKDNHPTQKIGRCGEEASWQEIQKWRGRCEISEQDLKRWRQLKDAKLVQGILVIPRVKSRLNERRKL
jgi:hypothetical protein